MAIQPRRLRFRKLRIAWSVAFGIVAVLLCVLWVRSYWRTDSMYAHLGNLSLAVNSRHSELLVSVASGNVPWGVYSDSDEDWQGVSHVNGQSYPFSENNILGLGIPIILPVVMFAAVPAVQVYRAGGRFALRTLLIATAIVAVVLGIPAL